ncbi:hypothetical protein FRC17_007187, partial [Serendipita sp. 399]
MLAVPRFSHSAKSKSDSRRYLSSPPAKAGHRHPLPATSSPRQPPSLPSVIYLTSNGQRYVRIPNRQTSNQNCTYNPRHLPIRNRMKLAPPGLTIMVVTVSVYPQPHVLVLLLVLVHLASMYLVIIATTLEPVIRRLDRVHTTLTPRTTTNIVPSADLALHYPGILRTVIRSARYLTNITPSVNLTENTKPVLFGMTTSFVMKLVGPSHPIIFHSQFLANTTTITNTRRKTSTPHVLGTPFKATTTTTPTTGRTETA